MAAAGANSSEMVASYGRSVHVPNVQALAATGQLTEIPDRYIWPDRDVDPVRSSDDDELEIPVVDLSRLVDPESYQEEASKLRLGCEDWGFFQLINHGVPDELVERMKAAVEEFFALPLEEKETCREPNTVEGYCQALKVVEDQKLHWEDDFFLFTQPVTARNMRIWPTNPSSFRDVLDEYSSELHRTTTTLVGFMVKDLGFPAELLAERFKNGRQTVKFNYYPPCPQPDKVLGGIPHCDINALTLLLQVNDVQGLQIKRNGQWILIKPLPGAFIVNIGAILEIMTNGRYKSIEHRAIVNTKKERVSMATFQSPSYDTMIGPVPELVAGKDALFKTVTPAEYMKLGASKRFDGKVMVDLLKLKK